MCDAQTASDASEQDGDFLPAEPEVTPADKPDPDGDHGGPDDLAFLGIDPATGQPLRPPKKWEELRACVLETFRLHETLPGVVSARKLEEGKEPKPHRGRPPQGVDEKNLASAGWAVVYAEGVEPEIKAALAPLLALRREQAGERLFKVFDKDRALGAGVSAADWLRYLGVGVGVGRVEKVPYYLAVVGRPEQLPFGLEFDLAGSSYAPGRLAFATPEEAARYADNVIAAETAPPRRAGKLALVGMEHPDDVTRTSRRCLVEPLLEAFPTAEPIVGEAATKRGVARVLGGEATPAVVFTAGHALGPGPGGDLRRVGSLLCAPYPGPVEQARQGNRPLPEEWIFGPADLGPEADLRGVAAVLFGCFSAGMPAEDSFCCVPPRPLGPATMAALATRLLTHERGAVAVLGHVDRAWSYSYRWEGIAQPEAFRSVLGALLDGEPVGAAASYLSDRYQALALELLRQKEKLLRGQEVETDGFVRAWMSERDARSYLVFGDPAARPALG